jgi:hypothetical protein
MKLLVLSALLTVALAGCHHAEPSTEEAWRYIIPECQSNGPPEWTVYVSSNVAMGQAAQTFEDRGWSNITQEFKFHNSLHAECPLAQ